MVPSAHVIRQPYDGGYCVSVNQVQKVSNYSRYGPWLCNLQNRCTVERLCCDQLVYESLGWQRDVAVEKNSRT